MRKLLPLLMLLASPVAWADYFVSGFHASGYFEDGYFEGDGSLTTVPNVVGEANFAAADAILEGVGLDGGTETVRCSAETANEIIAQNPAAGVGVVAATAVDLVSSSGTACSGRPLQIGIGKRLGVDL